MKNLFIVNALFISNLLYSFAIWFVVILITKFSGVAAVGEFSLALAVLGPLFAITGLNMKAIQIIHDDDDYTFIDYINARLYGIIVAVIVSGLLFAVYLKSDVGTLVFVGLLLYKVAEAASDISHGEYQRQHQLLVFARSRAGRALIAAIFFTLLLLVNIAVPYALLGWGGMALVFWFYFDVYSKPSMLSAIKQGIGSYRPAWRIAVRAFPLGIVLFLNILNINLGRFVIHGFEGVEQVGVYSALTHFFIVGTTFMNALMQFFARGLCEDFQSNLARHYRSFFIMLGVGFLGGIVGILIAYYWGYELLILIYNAEIAQYHSVFVWVMVAAMMIYVSSAFGSLLTARGIIKPQVPMNVMVTSVILLASLVFVHHYGLIGAVYGMLAAYSTKLIMQIYLLLFDDLGVMMDKHRVKHG